jgi:hypothetical protein
MSILGSTVEIGLSVAVEYGYPVNYVLVSITSPSGIVIVDKDYASLIIGEWVYVWETPADGEVGNYEVDIAAISGMNTGKSRLVHYLG